MKYLLTTLLLSIYTISCNEDDIVCLPACLVEKIAYVAEHHCDETANITMYSFQNAEVYYIDPGHCADDQSYDVINSNCEVIGRLEGFTGNTMINGLDFYEHAKLIRIVWEK